MTSADEMVAGNQERHPRTQFRKPLVDVTHRAFCQCRNR